MVKELEDEGILEQIISHEEAPKQVQEDEDPDSTAVNSEESSDGETIETLKKIESRKPKKFVEDEKREKGRVKMHIYSEYISASGGWQFWTLAFVAFLLGQAVTTGKLRSQLIGRMWECQNVTDTL